MAKPKKQKRILIDLSAEVHEKLTKIASSHAARLKPYVQKILNEYTE